MGYGYLTIVKNIHKEFKHVRNASVALNANKINCTIAYQNSYVFNKNSNFLIIISVCHY